MPIKCRQKYELQAYATTACVQRLELEIWRKDKKLKFCQRQLQIADERDCGCSTFPFSPNSPKVGIFRIECWTFVKQFSDKKKKFRKKFSDRLRLRGGQSNSTYAIRTSCLNRSTYFHMHHLAGRVHIAL